MRVAIACSHFYRPTATNWSHCTKLAAARPSMDHTIRVCRCFGPKQGESGCLHGCMGTTPAAAANSPRTAFCCPPRHSSDVATKARIQERHMCRMYDANNLLLRTSAWHRIAELHVLQSRLSLPRKNAENGYQVRDTLTTWYRLIQQY